jgi:serine/threonine protein kinase
VLSTRSIPEALIEKECRALAKIYQHSSQPDNIVASLQIGRLRPHSWFIDMELCEYALKDFLDSSLPEIPHLVQDPHLRASQIWNVMSQIAKGVTLRTCTV